MCGSAVQFKLVNILVDFSELSVNETKKTYIFRTLHLYFEKLIILLLIYNTNSFLFSFSNSL